MQFFLSLLIVFGLISVPDAAFSAASDAALLWWTRVLPSLLPYLIAASLLSRSNSLYRLPRSVIPFLLLPFGILGGYPVGAKLAGKLYQDGALTLSDARKAAAFINLPNPVFLISVVSAGLFQDLRTAAPLLIGIYGAALFGLFPLSRISFCKTPPPVRSDAAHDLPSSIWDGVQSILNIGGCIVFASVLGALIDATGVSAVFGSGQNTARAITRSVFEMTCGASAIAALPLSLSMRLALCAFFIQFGGISVLLQSCSALPLSLPRYCLIRLATGLVAATAIYVLTPLFCPEIAVATMAGGTEMLQNTIDLLAVSISGGIGVLLVFVFTFGLKARKRTP